MGCSGLAYYYYHGLGGLEEVHVARTLMIRLTTLVA